MTEQLRKCSAESCSILIYIYVYFDIYHSFSIKMRGDRQVGDLNNENIRATVLVLFQFLLKLPSLMVNAHSTKKNNLQLMNNVK